MFSISCYQAVILLLFNKHEQLTFSEIKVKTNIPDTEILQQLIFLCNPRQKILDKENMKKPEFADNEVLKVT